MKRLTTYLLAGAAAAAMGFAVPEAHATIVFSFDLAGANGLTGSGGSPTYTGMGNTNNVTALELGSGSSTIIQNLSGGSPTGQTFTETGNIQVTGLDLTTQATIAPLPIPSGYDVYFTYNLTGSISSTGEVIFTSGTADLFVEQNGNLSPAGGGDLLLAVFDLNPGATGSTLGGNNIPSSSLQLSFHEDLALSPVQTLFDQNGAIIDALALELANIQPVLDTLVANNPSFNGCTGAIPGTCTSENIVVTDQGQLQLAVAVPEPASLAIFGSGLVGLGALSRRRKKKSS